MAAELYDSDDGPNEVVEPVHGRMPVILKPGDYGRWLSRGIAEQLPLDLLRPFAAEEMVVEAAGDEARDEDEVDSL